MLQQKLEIKKLESTRRTLHEVEVLRNEILAVIHDEDAANIRLDVVPLLLGLEQVEWSAAGRTD